MVISEKYSDLYSAINDITAIIVTSDETFNLFKEEIFKAVKMVHDINIESKDDAIEFGQCVNYFNDILIRLFGDRAQSSEDKPLLYKVLQYLNSILTINNAFITYKISPVIFSQE